MTQASARLRGFLDQHGASYKVLPHRRDFSAQRTAAHTHTPGHRFAKCVVVRADGRYAMVVVPACGAIQLGSVRRMLGAATVRLATEDELFELFPDCEVGSEPPFGNLYGLPVYLSEELLGAEEITFNAGSHEEAIRMRTSDFELLVRPELFRIDH